MPPAEQPEATIELSEDQEEKLSDERPMPMVHVGDPVKVHDANTRAALAFAIVGTLLFTMVPLWICVFTGRLEVKEFLQTVFPALTGLTGTAVGFYFSDRGKS